MPFPALALLSSPRNMLVAGLALGLAAVSLFAYVQTVRLDSANTRADALGQRLVNANAQVAKANAATQQAAAINKRLNDAIARHRQAVQDARTLAERREALQRKRDAVALQVAAEARTRDRARRERLDVPPAEEMSDALAEAMGGR